MNIDKLFSLLKPPEVLSKESQQAYQGKVEQAKQESQMIREKVVNPFFSFADKSFKKIMEVMNPGESYVAPALKKIGVNPIVAGGIGLGVDILAPGPGELGRVAKVGKEAKAGSKLLQEAKKYKSAEEFVKAQKSNPIYKNFTSDVIGNSKVGRENLLNVLDSGRYAWRAARDASILIENVDLPDNVFRSIVGKTKEGVLTSLDENLTKFNIEKTISPPSDAKKINSVIKYAEETKSQLTDIWNKAQIDERLAPLANEDGTVTVYRASAKFPKDKFAEGTFFATNPDNARYYAESWHKGDPSDIKIKEYKIPANLLKRGGSSDAWQLKTEWNKKTK